MKNTKAYAYCHKCKTTTLHEVEKPKKKIKFVCSVCKDVSAQYDRAEYDNFESVLRKKHLKPRNW